MRGCGDTSGSRDFGLATRIFSLGISFSSLLSPLATPFALHARGLSQPFHLELNPGGKQVGVRKDTE